MDLTSFVGLLLSCPQSAGLYVLGNTISFFDGCSGKQRQPRLPGSDVAPSRPVLHRLQTARKPFYDRDSSAASIAEDKTGKHIPKCSLCCSCILHLLTSLTPLLTNQSCVRIGRYQPVPFRTIFTDLLFIIFSSENCNNKSNTSIE